MLQKIVGVCMKRVRVISVICWLLFVLFCKDMIVLTMLMYKPLGFMFCGMFIMLLVSIFLATGEDKVILKPLE